MPNRLSHCCPLGFQLCPDGGAEAVFDQIVATPRGCALLHLHCPPGGSSHASHASETAWVCVSNIPLPAKFATKRYLLLGLFSCQRSLYQSSPSMESQPDFCYDDLVQF